MSFVPIGVLSWISLAPLCYVGDEAAVQHAALDMRIGDSASPFLGSRSLEIHSYFTASNVCVYTQQIGISSCINKWSVKIRVQYQTFLFIDERENKAKESQSISCCFI